MGSGRCVRLRLALAGGAVSAAWAGAPAGCAFQNFGTSLGADAGATAPGGAPAGGQGGAVGGGGAGASGGRGGEGASGAVGGFGAAGGQGGAGGLGGAGGGGGPVCGNGTVEPPERCDDQNLVDDDGCTDCSIDAGYECSTQPSECTPIAPAIVSAGPSLGLVMKDAGGGYDGSLATMDCIPLVFTDQGYTAVKRVEVTLGIDHTYVGDLIVKVASPSGTVTTVMSRPGLDEPLDTYDETNGDSSNLQAGHPITFRDGGAHDAESMGSGLLAGGVVCGDDGRCDYFPNHGAGPGTSMADFVDQSPVGTWQICVGDGDDGDQGTIQHVVLSVLAW